MREVASVAGGTFPVHAQDISGWAEIRPHRDGQVGHSYAAYAGDKQIGVLRYVIDFPDVGIITVGGLTVEAEYRNRGVAVALIAALHAAHPEHKISPHLPREEGLPFLRHIIDTEPTVREFMHLRPEVTAQL